MSSETKRTIIAIALVGLIVAVAVPLTQFREDMRRKQMEQTVLEMIKPDALREASKDGE